MNHNVTQGGSVSETFDRILSMVEQDVRRGEAKLLDPLVRSRKGIYRDLFLRLQKLGFDTVLVRHRDTETAPCDADSDNE